MFCPECGTQNKTGAKFCIRCGADLRKFIPASKFSPRSYILKPNTVLDKRYKILNIIEKGGMGAVYRALDMRLDNICAVKEMRENFEKDEYRIYAIEKFKSEALILSKLRHPNIPRVFDYFIENNRYYLVMDYIDGKTLYRILQSRPSKRLEEEELRKWTLQLCDVLSYLHHQEPPIIYRDLKPGNIMINKEDKVMLIDFGIARIFNPKSKGTMIGTQGYAPPEQYRGQVDPRSDIYALGATLHHLITGRDPQDDAPFSFPPVKELRKDVSDSFAYLIEKCLKFNPEERFSSVEEIKDFLQEKNIPTDISPPVEEKVPPKEDLGLTKELEKLLFDIEKSDPYKEKPKEKDLLDIDIDEILPDEIKEGLNAVKSSKKKEEVILSKEEEESSQSLEEDLPEFEDLEKMPDQTLQEVFEIKESISNTDLFEKLASPSNKKNMSPKETKTFSPPITTKPLGSFIKKTSTLKARPTIPFAPIEIKSQIKTPPIKKTKIFAEKIEKKEFVEEPKVSSKQEEEIELEPFAGAHLLEKGIFATDESTFEKPMPQSTPPPQPKKVMSHPWTMYRKDKYHTGHSEKSSPCGGSLKWRFHTNGRIYSSPTFDSTGVIYFGSNDGCLYAIYPDGKEKWRFLTDGSILTTPLIIEGVGIFFGSEDSHFYALDFEGHQMWKMKMAGAIYSSAVAGKNNTLYVGSNDGNLYALNIHGDVEWKFTIDNFLYSSPALGPDETIYIGSWDKHMYAISPQGKLLWKFKTDGIIDSSPAIDGAGYSYFGSHDNYIYAVDYKGRLKWRFKTKDKISSSPALHKEMGIFIGSYDNYLYHIDFSGRLQWKFRAGYWIKSSPIIDGKNNIYFGCDDFACYCVNINGMLVWKFKTNGTLEMSPCITEKGVLYFGSNDGWLYALE